MFKYFDEKQYSNIPDSRIIICVHRCNELTFSINQCDIIPNLLFLIFKPNLRKITCLLKSFLIVDGRIIGISDESAWHSSHTDVIFPFYFIYGQNFRNILLVMLPKFPLLFCYHQ